MRPPEQIQEALGRREREVAEAYAGGLSYKEIARKFGIAPATVRTHLGTIYRKLGVSTKIALLRALDHSSNDTSAASEIARRAKSTAWDVHISEGRRQVTVLSATPEGLATLARKLDPEEMATFTAAFRREFNEVVERHGGRFLPGSGAQVTACFGLPDADETDAERAVTCALEFVERLSQPTSPLGFPLRSLIGIFTGPVVTMPTQTESEALVGGAAYLAATLGREATGGGVVVCARTRSILGGLFAFSNLGPVAIEENIQAFEHYSVRGATAAMTRFEGLHGYRLSPLIGRDHEIGLLKTLYDRAEAGEGQVAIISGEAGIGKSRMVRALSDRLCLPPDGMFVFQCSPHNRSSPLHAVTYGLRQIAGVEWHETAAERLEAFVEAFADALEQGSETEPRERALFADLAGIKGTSQWVRDMMPADERSAAMLALLNRLLLRRAASVGALLVVFEDMHWADPTTIDWLVSLVDLVETAPILILVTARPEFLFSRNGANVTMLALSRLSRSQSAELVRAQVGGRELPPDLIDRIAERAEGIPLYAEELARAILDLDETENAVPTTLSASLMSRLDRLGAAREVAQAAAVIGRDFEAALLKEIVPHGPKAFQKAIDAMLASRLVLRRGGAGSDAFQFKHALIRDAAYESLLRARRGALHLSLADVLVARRNRGDDIAPELIAEHLREGGQLQRSVPYWKEAAEIALIRGAQSESSAFSSRGLQASLSIEEPHERDTARCDLLYLKQSADFSGGDVKHLLKIIEEAEACARRLNDAHRLAHTLTSKIYNLTNDGRVSEAMDVAQSCIEISRNLDDRGPWVMASVMRVRSLFSAGRYGEAVEQALEVRAYLGENIERGFIGGDQLNQTVSVRIFLAFLLAELGRFDEAGDNLEAAEALIAQLTAKEHIALWWAQGKGRLMSMINQPRAAIETLRPMVRVSEAHYPVYLPRIALSLGPALVDVGETEAGLATLERARRLSYEKGFTFLRALLLAQYSRALLSAGEPKRAWDMADEGVKEAKRTGERGNLAWSTFAAGRAAHAMRRDDDAARLIREAATIGKELGMVPLLRSCGASGLIQIS